MTFTVEPILHYRTSYKSPSIKKIRFHCLQPIFTSTPPWIATEPSINLQLIELPKKSTSPITYRDRFRSLIINHPNSNICYTDGSKTNNRTGLAYSINNNLYSKRHRNSASVFTTELQEIYLPLQHILSNPSRLVQPTIIVSDLAALTAIANTNSDHPLVSRIHLYRIHAQKIIPHPHSSGFLLTWEFRGMRRLIKLQKQPPPFKA